MTSTNESKPTDDLDLKEKLAAIEHERWSDWQKWVHQQCTMIEDDEGDVQGFMIPAKAYEAWERQIKTPYAMLTPMEQSSDMEQVDRYWPLITQYVNKKVIEADGCPCLLVEPCSYACSCAKPTMSGGCMRCCKYGSMEQRISAAKQLATLQHNRGEQ